MDVTIAERALQQAIDADVDRAITAQARKEIDAFLHMEATRAARIRLKESMQTALQTRSLVWIRSGKSSSGATGTAAHMLQQAETELAACIEESKRVGLPVEAIQIAQRSLDQIRSELNSGGAGPTAPTETRITVRGNDTDSGSSSGSSRDGPT